MGIFHPPVSLRDTATVERHCRAKIKNTISPMEVAKVKSFSPVASIFAFLSELSNVLCSLSSSEVTLNVNAKEETKTSLAANADISDTPILQSIPMGDINGWINFPKSDAYECSNLSARSRF